MGGVGCVGVLAELLPVGLGHIDAELFGCGFDSVEGLFAVVVGDVFYLVEARDGVADVGGVFEGFLALVGEGVVGGIDFFAVVGREVVGFCWHGGAPGIDVLRRALCRLGGLDGGWVGRVWLGLGWGGP